jgi:ribonuclease HII
MLEQQMPGIVAGIDEVGRGPLAGPVVAACVVLPALLAPEMAAMLDDSKRLSADQRGAALAALRASGALIGIGAASVLEIERLNILQASLLAMRRAFAHLTPRPDAALVDGNRDPGLGVPTRCVVAGDSQSLSIAAASIVASLLFVGIQLRQGDRTQRAARLQSMLDGYRDRTFLPGITSGEVTDIWARGLTSLDLLDANEKRRF